MSVLFVVLPLALVASGIAVVAFVWAVRAGQLDDLDTPPLRALSDDPTSPRGSKAAAERAPSRPPSCRVSGPGRRGKGPDSSHAITQ